MRPAKLALQLALASALLVAACASDAVHKAKCRLVHPHFVTKSSMGHTVTTDGWRVRFLSLNEWSTPSTPATMDTAHLTIFPGKGFPPHRHKEGDEMIYVLSGRMEYSYWGAGMTEPATVLLGPGDSNYIRANELHKVWNSGSEDLVMIIASQKVAPMEFFDDFPSDYNAAGALVPVLPWEGACPPGQELVKDEL